MFQLVFKSNADQFGNRVLRGTEFDAAVFFPKIRNVNRLMPEHRPLVMNRTEKFDGQQVALHRLDNCLVFYSRNGILDLPSLGKGINQAWAQTDWQAIATLLRSDQVLYLEAVGNHKDFKYTEIFPAGFGLIAFAL